MLDYHIHTNFSCDSNQLPEDVCEKAIALGFEEIAFTEHLDLDPQDEGYGFYDYERISEKILELKEHYRGKLVIKKGIEITYQKKREQETIEFLQNKSYDFVVGSVHLLGDFDISQVQGIEQCLQSMSREDLFLSYFETTSELVKSDIFDVLGHFEMVRRYALKYTEDYTYEEFKEYIDRILKLMIKRGIALEVNTSGIRHLPGETYPRFSVIKRFLELGGINVTIGSDAHMPEHIGFKIKETIEHLQKMGVNELVTFSDRKIENRLVFNRK